MILVEAISSLTEQVAGTYDAQPNSAALSPPNNHKYICMDRILGLLFLIHCDSRHVEGHECVHGTMST